MDINDMIKSNFTRCFIIPAKMNSVKFLQGNRFYLLPYEDKIKVKELGRPTPQLNLEVNGFSRNKSYKRQFNHNLYARAKWLCGCDVKNALFCFPCLLFDGDKAWTITGVKDLGHITQSIKRHETTKKHLSNEVSLALLGNINIEHQLDSAYWINIQKYNGQVAKNREILSRIIDCIKLCGAFELAVRGHDETKDSSNAGVFNGPINFSAQLDDLLQKHLECASAFKGISKNIQNDLLFCMLEICRNKIISEINQSNYLAVMVEETTDVVSNCQLAVILRYVFKGNPVERFWGFINLQRRDVQSLSDCIFNIIDPLLKDNCNKLIAQAYGAITNGKQSGVHIKIKEKYPLAYFVHCYTHQLNHIMTQAVSQNPQVRVFFSNVDDFINFFLNFPQGLDILNKIMEKRMPHPVQMRWNLKSRAVNVIYENRISLIECMQQTQQQISNSKVINQASAIERLLCDRIFLFWLKIFHSILPYVDVLYNQLQTKKTNTIVIKNAIGTFQKCINNIREIYEVIIKKEEDIFISETESAPAPKQMRLSDENLRISALEVCDIITETAKSRFEYTNHLCVSSLFFFECFEEYSRRFPEEVFETTITTYPVFETELLKTELSVIYATPDFHQTKGVVAFLNMIKANNLEESFRETVKLLEIIITIPMATEEKERCLMTMNRMKNFMRNSISEDRLSAFSMLSIENCLVKSDSNFNEKVIEIFTTNKQCCVDLVYK